jgi:uncharacterized membrane protein YqaE (UPF0057 family)
MERIALLVSVVGVSIYLLAFAYYIREMLVGKAIPNAATWSLWAFLAIVNVATYHVMTGNLVLSVQSYGAGLMNVGTFLLALKRGKFAPLGKLDKVILAIGLAAVAVWIVGGSATWANMLLQVCIFISIIPTWVSVGKNPGSESPWPWLMLSLSYIFQLTVAKLTHSDVHAYVLPVNACAIQLVVALLAMRPAKKEVVQNGQ